jgi:hypothetical protein
MLGAMYGDMGFTIPFNPKLGHHDGSQIESKFIVGRSKMVRKGRFQNTRISALISLHNYDTFAKEACLYAQTDDGRSEAERWADVYQGNAKINSDSTPCVTVWENGAAKQRLPQDILRGDMDAWWTCDNEMQALTYVGHRRLALKIDK